MTPLTEAEKVHIDAFHKSRPSWFTVSMQHRIFDENDGSRVHKYPKPHPYITGMQYVLRRVPALAPCSVLDIGSPLVQNVALAAMPGIDVTVLDVRPQDDAPMLGLKWKNASAVSLPYPDASWKVVTSLWVMGHVGDGRYGDELDPEGDRKMLAEIARVLKPGGSAIIGPGLVDKCAGNIFNLHRIYSWEWLHEEFARVGLTLTDQRNLHVSDEWFIDRTSDTEGTISKRDGVYGLAVLTK